MKYISSFMTLAAFCVVLGTSCTKETNNYIDPDGDGDNDDRTAIELSSTVTMGALRLQDTQIAGGQELSFFVTRTGDTGSIVYNNQKITADGSGRFTYQTTMYYPTDGSNVDFYAVHPYSGSAEIEEEYPVTIRTNQSAATDYLGSDFLYAVSENVARTTQAVSMTFYHKMAKVDFIIKQGTGADISGLNTVAVMNALTETTIDLTDNGTLGEPGGDPAEILAYGVDDPNEEENGDLSGMTAIVVPQTIDAGRLFRIRLGSIDYYYTAGAGQTFSSGKKYTFTLTINQAGITVTSTIEDWLDGGSITGDGSID